MKKLISIIAFLTTLTAGAQNMYTNAPEIVFPVLEEFVAENFQRKTASFEFINMIDSIVVRDIPLIVDPPFVRKVFGRYNRSGNRIWIEIDSSLLNNPLKFAHTLQHELGHVFQLEHKDHKIYPKEIMSDEKYPYYMTHEEMKQAKENYFKELSEKYKTHRL